MIDLCAQLQNELTQNGVRGNRFGTTTQDVFNLAQLMSAIKAHFTKSDVEEVQKLLNINPKVWDKFLRIMNDPRISQLRYLDYKLPTSYTALYALAVMDDGELNEFLNDNTLDETISSRYILEWTKTYRILAHFA